LRKDFSEISVQRDPADWRPAAPFPQILVERTLPGRHEGLAGKQKGQSLRQPA
jgi:hypothetical protein